MTDKKISELTSLTGANVSDANDVVAIVDSDQNTTKKITRSEFFKSVSSVDINGGTIDGTVIGGSTPAAVTGTTLTATGDVDVADKITHTGDTDTSIRFPAADTVTVETAGSERVRVDSSGNVGIGKSSPTSMLDVQEGAAFGGVASSAQTGATVSIRQPQAYDPSDGDGTSAINIITQTTIADGSYMGGITWARMTSNGGTSAASISAIGEDNSNTGLAFATGTSNTERLRITSTGNVLIGTTTDGASKLRVVGLPTSSAGLSAGDIWNDGGTLKIV